MSEVATNLEFVIYLLFGSYFMNPLFAHTFMIMNVTKEGNSYSRLTKMSDFLLIFLHKWFWLIFIFCFSFILINKTLGKMFEVKIRFDIIDSSFSDTECLTILSTRYYKKVVKYYIDIISLNLSVELY